MRATERFNVFVDGASFAFLSRPARICTALLVAAAIIFCVAVVVWDVVAGTTTSTEPLVVVLAAAPLLIGVALVACIDYAVRRWRRAQRH